MNGYYTEIEQYIKRNEVNKVARKLEENQDILTNYWHIGRLLVEAQGGKLRAKYGNELIKKWSLKFTEKYGKGYSYTNMSRFRQFYLCFPILATASQLSWNQIQEVLPIKDINKRNYYINLCIKQRLTIKSLRELKRNNTYERLLEITDNIHNPILLELNKEEKIVSEHDLEVALLARLKSFFSQLGEGFLFAGNQYKIIYEGRNYFIDILLFNVKLNCFIVVELKVRNLRKEDKGQIEFYMELVDKIVKESFHNKTIGIIITKEQDKFIASFVGSENIIPLIYKIL